MGATSVSHGVIEINIKPLASVAPTAPSGAAVPQSAFPVSVGSPPPPVIVHKNAAELEAEAQSVATAAAQLKTDAEAAAQPAA